MVHNVESLNAREVVLSQNATDFKDVFVLLDRCKPFSDLWTTVAEWSHRYPQVTDGPLKELTASTIHRYVEGTSASMKIMCHRLESDGYSNAAALAKQTGEQIDTLKPYLPLLDALCNPALRQRHWSSLVTELEIKSLVTKSKDGRANGGKSEAGDCTESLCLKQLLQGGAMHHLDKVSEISEVATREAVVELGLDRMETTWCGTSNKPQLGILLSTESYGDARANGVRIVGSDAVFEMLDDHVTKAGALLCSPYAGPFEDALIGWRAVLVWIQSSLETLVAVQHLWEFLQPVFTSVDLIEQLPEQARRFAKVDATWHGIVGDVSAAANVLQTFLPGVTSVGEASIAHARHEVWSALETLADVDLTLQAIARKLSVYLERKRSLFPRFNFLADAELLEILAVAKDPIAMQPLYNKCFDGVSEVLIERRHLQDSFVKEGDSSDVPVLVGVISKQGEKVVFRHPVDPTGRRLDEWLHDLEVTIAESLRALTREAALSYAALPYAPRQSCNVSDPTDDEDFGRLNVFDIARSPDSRVAWALDWPQQVTLGVLALFSTAVLESAIRSGGENLAKLPKLMSKQLLGTARSTRHTRSSDRANYVDLESVAARLTRESLIVADVHTRDIAAWLKSSRTTNIHDFNWQSHFRCYLHPASSTAISDNNCATLDGRLQCRMLRAEFDVAGEYTGNSSRLVITPLTDRCYRTLLHAVHHGFGGALQGPAGTGKTETTKDLAKALGLRCVVFNCSDGLDHFATAKLFRGVLGCGAWACFDEFNRMLVETLSVVSQQLRALQGLVVSARMDQKQDQNLGFGDAIVSCHPCTWSLHHGDGNTSQDATFNGSSSVSGNKRLKAVFYEGGKVRRILPTAAVFVTMNPSYKGRSSLPETLRLQLRPMAMVQADISMIAEVKFLSLGFESARSVAIKLTTALEMAELLMSRQRHYDFGMRALGPILDTAGKAKHDTSNKPDIALDAIATEEAQLVAQAVLSCSLPKLTAADADLFADILRDSFPGVRLNTRRTSSTTFPGAVKNTVLQEAIDVEGLVLSDSFLIKVRQLESTMRVRHGVMLVGPTASGKSSCYRSLARAFEQESNVGIGDRNPTDSRGLSNCVVINPKAMSVGRLYGEYDVASREWRDGVLANIVRSYVKAGSQMGGTALSRKWVVLDGPVDPSWVESLNTALDENRKLCLNSGEILRLTPNISITFEVDTLCAASPATVSRCGIVHFDADTVGWEPITESWLNSLPATLQRHSSTLRDLFGTFVPLAVKFVANQGVKTSAFGPTALTARLVRCLYSLLSDFLPIDGAKAREKLRMQGTSRMMAAARKLRGRHARLTVTAVTKSMEPRSSSMSSEDAKRDLQCHFIFALAWSFCGSLDSEARTEFDEEIVHGLLHKNKSSGDVEGKHVTEPFLSKPPPLGRLFEVRYDSDSGEWVDWLSASPSGEGSIPLFSRRNLTLFVPTPASGALSFFIKNLVPGSSGSAVLIGGSGACGKTTQGSHAILAGLVREEADGGVPHAFEAINIPLHSHSGSSSLHAAVEDRLVRLRAGVLGPALERFGGESSSSQTPNVVYFVDDLHAPAPGPYGARPALQLLRTWLDHGESFAFDSNEPTQWRYERVNFVATAQNKLRDTHFADLPERLLRHFFAFRLPPLSDEDLFTIFRPSLRRTLDAIIGSADGGSNKDELATMEKLLDPILRASCHLHDTLSDKLRPTPTKCYYSFDTHDLRRVFDGVDLARRNVASGSGARSCGLKRASDLIRLWTHECERVYHDQLRTEDMEVFHVSLAYTLEEVLTSNAAKSALQDAGLNVSGAHSRGRRGSTRGTAGGDRELIFGDVLVPNAMDRIYTDLRLERHALRTLMESYHAEWRSSLPRNETCDLVFFDTCVDHVVRLCRILLLHGGHALLVGAMGSGRRSAVKLATFIEEFELSFLDPSPSMWRDDLTRLATLAACGSAPVVVLITEDQLKNDCLNSKSELLAVLAKMIGSGNFAALLTSKERTTLVEDLRANASMAASAKSGVALTRRKDSHAVSDADVLAYFEQQCFERLHIVLCFDPSDLTLRNALRSYPCLASYTTIDYYGPWSPRALRDVAEGMLHAPLSNAVEDATDVDAEVDRLASLCPEIHAHALWLAESEHRRSDFMIFVTPSSYVHMLQTLGVLCGRRRAAVISAKARYVAGIAKLNETKLKVTSMQKDLEDLRPELEVKSKNTSELMVRIETETREADIERQKIAMEEGVAAEDATATQALADECTKELERAMPAFNAAMEALKTLQKKDLDEIKALHKPPANVKLTMESICLMLGVAPAKVKDPNNPSGKKLDDYWEPSKRLLSDPKGLLLQLEHYNKDRIPEAIMASLRNERFLYNESFTPEIMAKSSVACYSLCAWVRAMDVYDVVAKEIAPKRASLKVAQAKLSESNSVLETKRSKIREVDDAIANLQAELITVQNERANLESETKLCETRLVRAEQLLRALSGERLRWSNAEAKLCNSEACVLGDCTAVASLVAYFGAFTEAGRRAGIEYVLKLLQQNGEKFTPAIAFDESQLGRRLSVSSGSRDSETKSGRSNLRAGVAGAEVCPGCDADTMRRWCSAGLPAMEHAMQCALVVSVAVSNPTCDSGRWPLLVDPHRQGIRWVVAMHEKENPGPIALRPEMGGGIVGNAAGALVRAKLAEDNLVSKLQSAMAAGSALVVEGVVGGNFEMIPSFLNKVLKMQRAAINPRATESNAHGSRHTKSRNVFKEGYVRVGGELVQCEAGFTLYMVSSVANPDLNPALASLVTLVNFTVTRAGLEEELLLRVVANKRPADAASLAELTAELSVVGSEITRLEDSVLIALTESEGNLLDDEALIGVLRDAQEKAAELKVIMRGANDTQRKIMAASSILRPLASRASTLYATLASLVGLCAVYRFDLDWFIDSFMLAIDDTAEEATIASQRKPAGPPPELTKRRISDLMERATYAVFVDVCRGLQSKHHLLFAFLLSLGILQVRGEITSAEIHFLLTGVAPPLGPDSRSVCDGVVDGNSIVESALDVALPDSASTWLSKRAWAELQQLSNLPISSDSGGGSTVLRGITEKVSSSLSAWRDWVVSMGGSSLFVFLAVYSPDSVEHWGVVYVFGVTDQKRFLFSFDRSDRVMSAPMPGGIDSALSLPQRLMLLRCLLPAALAAHGVQAVVRRVLGNRFVSRVLPDIKSSFARTICTTPLVFLSCEGSDPTVAITNLARTMRRKVVNVSLGRGQEDRALNAVARGRDSGHWVVLSNCHLHEGFMGILRRLVESTDPETTVAQYRLWLVTEPCPFLPPSVLQASVKLADDPQQGLRSKHLHNLSALQPLFTPFSSRGVPATFRTSRDDNDESNQSATLRGTAAAKLVFAATAFHAALLERRSYGTIGFSRPYSFDSTDLWLAASEMGVIGMATEDMAPGNDREERFDELRAVLGMLVYGGKVEDKYDLRALQCLLLRFCGAKVMEDSYSFAPRVGLGTRVSSAFSDGAIVQGGIDLALSSVQDTFFAPRHDEVEELGELASCSRRVERLAESVECAEVVGLHDSATSMRQVDTTYAFLEAASLLCKGGAESAATGATHMLKHACSIAKDVMGLLPRALNTAVVMGNRADAEALVVLRREVVSASHLRDLIVHDVQLVVASGAGLAAFDANLEAMCADLAAARVPPSWATAMPSLLTLAPWLSSLDERFGSLRAWTKERAPRPVILLGHLFHPKSFVANIIREHARSRGVPLVDVRLDFVVVGDNIANKAPGVGCYLGGLRLDGARWCNRHEALDEIHPRELQSELPVLWLKPRSQSEGVNDRTGRSAFYECPVYRHRGRGMDNFVLEVKLRVQRGLGAVHWAQRGVAALLE